MLPAVPAAAREGGRSGGFAPFARRGTAGGILGRGRGGVSRFRVLARSTRAPLVLCVFCAGVLLLLVW